MQNESETEFHRVYKVSPTQQLTKLTHLLRESGADVTGSVKQTVCSQTAAADSDRLTEHKLLLLLSCSSLFCSSSSPPSSQTSALTTCEC